MGKGDRKTKKGKRFKGSYGKTRTRKSGNVFSPPPKPAKAKKAEPVKEEKTTKKPAAKKTATKAKTTTKKKTTAKKTTAKAEKE